MRRTFLTAVVALTGVTAAAAAQAPAPLRFCLADHNLPMSAASPPSGVEVELARALSGALDRDAELRWLDEHEEGHDVVLRGGCDFAFGGVIDPGLADGHLPPDLVLTAPYYAAAYQLVRRRGAPPVRTLAELGASRIGVESESVAIYTLKQRGQNVYALHDYDAVIRAVADGDIDYGYLWGPLAAHLLRDRDDVVVTRGFRPEDRWNFALIGRRADRVLVAGLDAAIRRLERDGVIAQIFERYAVPYLAPTLPADEVP